MVISTPGCSPQSLTLRRLPSLDQTAMVQSLQRCRSLSTLRNPSRVSKIRRGPGQGLPKPGSGSVARRVAVIVMPLTESGLISVPWLKPLKLNSVRGSPLQKPLFQLFWCKACFSSAFICFASTIATLSLWAPWAWACSMQDPSWPSSSASTQASPAKNRAFHMNSGSVC